MQTDRQTNKKTDGHTDRQADVTANRDKYRRRFILLKGQ
jgi:hypothetical protein